MGFVRSVGRAFDDAIIHPVVKTVEAVIEDPKKLAMVALSVMAPGVGTALGSAMGLTGTAATLVGQAAINTALNGGDVKSAILAAALPVVGQEAASLAASSFVDAGMDTALAQSAGKIVAGTGMAAAQGKDPLSALIAGGLSEGTAAITRDIPGYSDLPDAAKRSINAAVATELAGGDATQAVINAAMNAGINTLANYTNSLTVDKAPDVVDQLLKSGMPSPDEDFVSTLPTSTGATTGPGYYNEITGEFVANENGGLQNPLGPETGNFDPNQKWEYSLTRPGVWTNEQGEEIDLSYMPDRDTAMTGKELMERAGVMPGGAKAPTTKAPTGAPARTSGTGNLGNAIAGVAGALGAGAAGAGTAIPNMSNTAQQQSSNTDLLNFLSSQDKGADIKSFKEILGEDLFGGKYVPPSAGGAQSEESADYGRESDSSTASQNEGDGLFYGGGHVDDFDVDALLQILRG